MSPRGVWVLEVASGRVLKESRILEVSSPRGPRVQEIASPTGAQESLRSRFLEGHEY